MKQKLQPGRRRKWKTNWKTDKVQIWVPDKKLTWVEGWQKVWKVSHYITSKFQEFFMKIIRFCQKKIYSLPRNLNTYLTRNLNGKKHGNKFGYQTTKKFGFQHGRRFGSQSLLMSGSQRPIITFIPFTASHIPIILAPSTSA